MNTTQFSTPERDAHKPHFDRVCNQENRKMPIDAVVDLSDASVDLEKIRQAIEFFTASRASFRNVGGSKIQVTAPGYYRAVGA